jgi:hypothetical protein
MAGDKTEHSCEGEKVAKDKHDKPKEKADKDKDKPKEKADKDKDKPKEKADREKPKEKADKKADKPKEKTKEKSDWIDFSSEEGANNEGEAPKFRFSSPLRDEMCPPPMMSPWGYMPMTPMGTPMGMHMPMSGFWPSPGFCGPMSMGCVPDQDVPEEDIIIDQEYDTDFVYEEDKENEEVVEAVVMEEESSEPEEDLLKEFREMYEPKVGDPVRESLAGPANNMWAKGRDTEFMKNSFKKFRRPSNIKFPEVECNPEVRNSAGKWGKAYENRLRALQRGLVQSTVPVLRGLDIMMQPGPVNVERKTKAVNTIFEGLAVVGTLNANLNNFRREILKPRLESKYRPICELNPKGDCDKLFGEDIKDDLKNATEVGRLSVKRNRGRGQYGGRYQPYPSHGRGRGRGGFDFSTFGRGFSFGRGYGGYNGGYRNQGQQNQGGYNYMYMLGGTPYMGVANRQFDVQKPRITSVKRRTPESKIERIRKVHDISSSDNDSDDCQSESDVEVQNDDIVVSSSRAEERPRAAVSSSGQRQREVNHEGLISISTKVRNPFRFRWNVFKAGRASICSDQWARITSDRYILKDIRGYHITFQETPVQRYVGGQISYSMEERLFLRKEIRELVGKGVIVEVDHIEGEYISHVFLREKKDKDKFRMILNLKKVNQYIEKEHFKMDTLTAALAMVYEGCWFLSLDFTDAYYTVRVAPESRKFLRFEFEGRLYEFTCLPNGLRPAPRLFTKVLKVPLAHLRKVDGLQITAYLDDTLLVFDTEEEALELGARAATLLQDLGFMISEKKSVLTPTKKIDFLGVVIDSKEMKVTLSEEKSQKIRDKVVELIRLESCTIRDLARVLGTLQATGPANPVAALYTKVMERVKNEELRKNQGRFDRNMFITQEIKEELAWWKHNLLKVEAPIKRAQPDITLYTDASLKGWGCYDKELKTSFGGRWDVDEDEQHINVLELKAVELALRTKCREVTDKHVKIFSDNMTTVASIRKQGSVRSPTCHEVAHRIWEFMLRQENWITIAHCPGVDNVEADKASREFNDETEWTLHQDVVDNACERFGIEPEIDLFASRLNFKAPSYCAWQPDPEAEYVDAFSGFWGGGRMVYAFPPFGILGQVLKKFYDDGAEGIVVVPYWITKPWFTQWGRLLVDVPLMVNINDNRILFLPHRTKQTHPMRGKLTLLLGRLSTDASRRRDFLERQSRLCYKGGENPPRNYTIRTGTSGKGFVVGGVMIQPRLMS